MTYDTPFCASLWLHSAKQHLLLCHTLHICNNGSLFMDQLLTFTLCFDHFSHHLVTCIFSEHTIFHFLEDCRATHPEDICFLLIYVMEMTVAVPSWINCHMTLEFMIMKEHLFIRQCIMTYDESFYGSL